MATIDKLMDGQYHGNKKKLTRKGFDRYEFFEPIFKDIDGDWHGINEIGEYVSTYDFDAKVSGFKKYRSWKEWIPEEKEKDFIQIAKDYRKIIANAPSASEENIFIPCRINGTNTVVSLNWIKKNLENFKILD